MNIQILLLLCCDAATAAAAFDSIAIAFFSEFFSSFRENPMKMFYNFRGIELGEKQHEA